MKLSIEWIRDYINLPQDLCAKEVIHDLTLATVEVEGAENTANMLENIVVARIISADPLGDENATLAICDVGRKEPMQIVYAGDSAIRSGTDVILALPGAKIHSLTGGGPVMVSPRKVCDQLSEGLICCAQEVGLEDVLFPAKPCSIVELNDLDLAPGTALASAIGWNDLILDIDNKSLTNRPDLWCHQGMARELAAIYGLPLRCPQLADGDWKELSLIGEVDPEICRRFRALQIEDVVIGPSPLWLRSRLARVGIRPINVVVDLTNYVMLDVGQPIHAYDSACLRLPFGVRRADAGEELTLLDGSHHVLNAANTVVTDAGAPLAAAGIIGGQTSMVVSSTASLIVEAANFHPVAIRRSAASLGIRSEASVRFEKGLDTQRVDLGTSRFAALLLQCLPQARITGQDVRENSHTQPAQILVDADLIVSRLDNQVDPTEVVDRLSSIGFKVERLDDKLNVKVPTWRSTGDVSIAHDLIEEVARLHGYENFVPTPLRIELHAPITSRERDLERIVKEALASQGGMQEVVVYPWIDDHYILAAGYDPKLGLQLTDPPSPEQSTLQPSLVPGLLECIETNLRFESAFRVFASDDVYGTQFAPVLKTGEMLPAQRRQIAAAFVGRDLQQLIREARGILDDLFRIAHLKPYLATIGGTAPWAARGAQLSLAGEEGEIGHLAAVGERARSRAGLKQVEVVIFTLFLDMLQPHPIRENHYVPPPVYQQVEKDFSLVFPRSVKWCDIVDRAVGVHPLIQAMFFVDAYEGPAIPEGSRSITLRVTMGEQGRTLKGAEIEAASARFLDKLRQLGGIMRT